MVCEWLFMAWLRTLFLLGLYPCFPTIDNVIFLCFAFCSLKLI